MNIEKLFRKIKSTLCEGKALSLFFLGCASSNLDAFDSVWIGQNSNALSEGANWTNGIPDGSIIFNRLSTGNPILDNVALSVGQIQFSEKAFVVSVLNPQGVFNITGLGVVNAGDFSQRFNLKQGATFSFADGALTGSTPLAPVSYDVNQSKIEFLGNSAGSGLVNLSQGSSVLELKGSSTEVALGSLAAVSTASIDLGNNNKLVVGQANVKTAIHAPISGNGSDFIKVGSSVVTLTANNTFSGKLEIREGSVQIGSIDNIANVTEVKLDGGALGIYGDLIGNTPVVLASPSSIEANGINLEFNLPISGSIGNDLTLTSTSGGILEITGNNTYLGDTIIDGVGVKVASNQKLGDLSGSISFAGEASLIPIDSFIVTKDISLNYESTGSISPSQNVVTTISGQISGFGNFGVSGAEGSVVIPTNLDNNYSGLTILKGEGATLQISSEHQLGNTSGIHVLGEVPSTLHVVDDVAFLESVPLVIANGGLNLQVDAGKNLVFPGDISSSDRVLTIQGAGVVELKGNNSEYHPRLSVQGNGIEQPTLRIHSDNNLGSSESDLLLAGAALNFGSSTVTCESRTINIASRNGNLPKMVSDAGTINTIHGVIQKDPTSGLAPVLQVEGPGYLVLTNEGNSFGWGVNVVDGNLLVASNEALGLDVEGNKISLDGGSLEFYQKSVVSENRPLQLNGSNPGMIVVGDGTINKWHGSISGTQDLVVAAPIESAGTGILKLVGDNKAGFSGNLFLEKGNLTVNSALSSVPLTAVRAGASLGGLGSFNDVVVFGNLFPGDLVSEKPTLGPLQVKNLSFETGSTYSVILLNHGSNALHATGTVFIQPESNLVLTFSNLTRASFPVIGAQGGISGQFANIVNPFPQYLINLNYSNPNYVSLEFLGFKDFADNFSGGNLKSVATGFDKYVKAMESTNPTESLLRITRSKELNKVLNVLNTLNESEMELAFNQFDPGLYIGLNVAELDLNIGLLDLYSNHVNYYRLSSNTCCFQSAPIARSCSYKNPRGSLYCAEEPCECTSSFWITPFAFMGDRGSSGDLRAYRGYNNDTYGVASGIDTRPMDDLYVTGGLAYSWSKLNWSGLEALAIYNTFSAIVGSAYVNSCFSLDAAVSLSLNTATAKREVFVTASPSVLEPIAPIDYTIKNDNSALSIASSIEAKYNVYSGYITSNTLYSIWPFVKVDYALLHQFNYNEKDGDSLNLHIHARNADLLDPEAGVGISIASDGCLVHYFADVSIGFGQEFRFYGRTLNANFRQDAGSLFQVTGFYPRCGLVIPRATIGFQDCEKTFAMFLSYKGAFGSSLTENDLSLELSFAF